jgi:hypothetical protein
MLPDLDPDCLRFVLRIAGEEYRPTLLNLRRTCSHLHAEVDSLLSEVYFPRTCCLYSDGYCVRGLSETILLKYTLQSFRAILTSAKPSYICARCAGPVASILTCGCHENELFVSKN